MSHLARKQSALPRPVAHRSLPTLHPVTTTKTLTRDSSSDKLEEHPLPTSRQPILTRTSHKGREVQLSQSVPTSRPYHSEASTPGGNHRRCLSATRATYPAGPCEIPMTACSTPTPILRCLVADPIMDLPGKVAGRLPTQVLWFPGAHILLSNIRRLPILLHNDLFSNGVYLSR